MGWDMIDNEAGGGGEGRSPDYIEDGVAGQLQCRLGVEIRGRKILG